ncbi:putative F-box/LRR-repeat protein 23 [Solanum pennellii]|uniref:F-box/LRR-repeat protein 23 n=1 Tax=Solanum pennellii TaxID=28526 RepID=A0ABM1VGV4_SOLPN|nr:putative F-box/LRR-repeat protein 23 [Solanum pennellii]
MDILQRLGTIEIVESTQRVCSTWWKVCHDPAMWRVIDLKYDPPCVKHCVLKKICRIAVDRSQGQLLKISIHKFGNKDLLYYIAESVAGSLSSAAKNLPLLEELHIHLTLITEEDIESVGRYCPLLKSFTLNARVCFNFGYSRLPDDGQALAIATSMPELRCLALILNPLTSVGLEAILDGCPHLVSLDLRRCNNIDLVGDIGRRCREQIANLKQPHDYEFDSEVSRHYLSSYDNYKSRMIYSCLDSDTFTGYRNFLSYRHYHESSDDDDYFDIPY